MATIGVLNKYKMQIKRLSSLKDMKLYAVENIKTDATIQAYYDAEDKLSEKLDEYFAASIMFMSINKPHLYEVYIKLNKETVKARMLRQITNKKQSLLSYQLVIDRINKLQEQYTVTKKKTPQAITKLTHIKKTIARLEAWAKDLNYETDKEKKIHYKAGG